MRAPAVHGGLWKGEREPRRGAMESQHHGGDPSDLRSNIEFEGPAEG